MLRRRLLPLLALAAAALLTGCTTQQKSEDLAGHFVVDPSDPYGELKKFKGSVNLLTARLTVSFQHLFSIGELYKEGPRGDEIMKGALSNIKRIHAELAKYPPQAARVRATIPADNAKLLAAYDAYVTALKGVASIDYGDISQERIDALVQAGSDMEPLIP